MAPCWLATAFSSWVSCTPPACVAIAVAWTGSVFIMGARASERERHALTQKTQQHPVPSTEARAIRKMPVRHTGTHARYMQGLCRSYVGLMHGLSWQGHATSCAARRSFLSSLTLAEMRRAHYIPIQQAHLGTSFRRASMEFSNPVVVTLDLVCKLQGMRYCCNLYTTW